MSFDRRSRQYPRTVTPPKVCPVAMGEVLNDPEEGRAQRAVRAMLGMKKIDVAALQAAADQA